LVELIVSVGSDPREGARKFDAQSTKIKILVGCWISKIFEAGRGVKIQRRDRDRLHF